MNLKDERKLIESTRLNKSTKTESLSRIETINLMKTQNVAGFSKAIIYMILAVIGYILCILLIGLFNIELSEKLIDIAFISLPTGAGLGLGIISIIFLRNDFLIKKRVTSSFDNFTIDYPPGIKMMKIIDFLYSSKIKVRVFEPIIADMQSEYIEALDNQLSRKARWIHYRGVFTVVLVAITQLPIFLVDIIIKIKKIG